MNTQTRSTIQSAGRVASAYLAAKVGALTGDIPVTGISLPQNEIWRIDRKTTGMVIECLAGMVWITQPGDPNDYILLHGDRFWVTRPGLVLVQAIRDAHFNCSWARGRM